jgi:dolichol-phosphate mannosyltransferase
MRELESLSVVVPGWNEAEMLPLLYRELVRVLGSRSWRLEILFVDDGSTDETLRLCQQFHRDDPRFNYISLSRNFGHQRALTAGLDHCTGQAVAVMDADLQDPPEVVLEMIERWRHGVDMVYGQRRSRAGETRFKKFTATAYYRIIRFFSGMSLPADTGDFRLLDRQVVESLGRVREQGRFMRGLVHWVGFRQEALLYDRRPRAAGETKYPLFKMLRFAWDGITSFSTMPLRLATWVGFGVFVAAAVLIVFYFFRKMFFHDDFVPGWTALIMAVLGFGGLQMFFIGLLGEYVAKCFEEAKGRPLYLVRASSLPAPATKSEV